MGGFSLCDSTLLHPCLSGPLSCSQNLCFFAYSPACLVSTCISFMPRARQTLCFRTVLNERREGFRSFAVKKQRHGGAERMDSISLDEEGEDNDDDEDWDTHEVPGDEGDDEVFLPLEKMKEWLESKPRGFGEGKMYNTTVEDKLLEEIEQSRKSQAANLNKLKNEPVISQPKRDSDRIKGLEDTQIGIRVRVSNLPRKKNIHKDLKFAFKEASGILNIIPAVSGNKKTRDPVCKGFAFVYFKSDKDANRFVDLFSEHKISFGKVQKQIKCQVLVSSLSSSSSEEEYSEDEQEEYPDSDSEIVSNADFVTEHDPPDELNEPGCSDKELDNMMSPKRMDKIKAEGSRFIQESAMAEKLIDISDESIRQLQSSTASSSSSSSEGVARIRQLEQKLLAKGKLWDGAESDQVEKGRDKVGQKKNKKKKKTILAKGNAKKGLKLEIPGSSKRLKIKEKALLTGVLSKYAARSASGSNDE